MKYSNGVRRKTGQRIPRRRPYRLQMRNRNNGRKSHLGFKNEKRKPSSNVGYINHKIGFVEDFGDTIGLVASESVQGYAPNPTAKETQLKKVKIYQLYETNMHID